MKLHSRRVLLTGATGGIGRATAQRLLDAGAQVLLVARDEAALNALAQSLALAGERVGVRAADLTQPRDRAALCDFARSWRGGIEILINNAGSNTFGLYEDLTAAQLDLCLALNVTAPMQLCRDLLPWLQTRDSAAIVNIGSVFGSIGFPGYAAYSATKFAMRGFSEALRRELAGTRVEVKYLAPRATRTAMNPPAVETMNSQLRVAMDPPERVARELVELLGRRGHSAVIGWPERLFVKINALLPRIVDRALRGQLSVIRAFARRPDPTREKTSNEQQDLAA